MKEEDAIWKKTGSQKTQQEIRNREEDAAAKSISLKYEPSSEPLHISVK